MIQVENSTSKSATLPPFTLDGFRNLIQRIKDEGFQIRSTSALPDRQENTVYLRHDLDFSVALAVEIAEIENAAGIQATYFVLLSGPYNCLHDESIRAIRRIKNLGHEIGLHYDLSGWPKVMSDALARLAFQIQVLESIAETKVNSIVMHQPSLGGEDHFATDDSGFINPSFYQKTDSDLCYVSDSCRAWRDDSLDSFIRRELLQTRMMLNIHPESWIAQKKMSRISFLTNVLFPAVSQSNRDYFLKTVRGLWETQPAAVNGVGDRDED